MSQQESRSQENRITQDDTRRRYVNQARWHSRRMVVALDYGAASSGRSNSPLRVPVRNARHSDGVNESIEPLVLRE